MEPMIFIYSLTIEGYDVTVTIEFFPHIVVLEDSSRSEERRVGKEC